MLDSDGDLVGLDPSRVDDVVSQLELCFPPEAGSDFEVKGIIADFKDLSFADMIAVPRGEAKYVEFFNPQNGPDLLGGPLGHSTSELQDDFPYYDVDAICIEVVANQGAFSNGDGAMERTPALAGDGNPMEDLLEWFSGRGFAAYGRIYEGTGDDATYVAYVETHRGTPSRYTDISVEFSPWSVLDGGLEALVKLDDCKDKDDDSAWNAQEGTTYTICWSGLKT